MFLNVLKAEFRRAFCGYSFYLAVLVGSLGGFIGIGLASDFKFTIFPNSSAYFAWSDGMGIIALLAPIIAVLPFGDSLALDRSSGFTRYLLMRTSSKSYIAAKWLANASAGALAVTLSVMLTFIFAGFLYPLRLPPEWVETVGGLVDGGEFLGLVELFAKSPGQCVILIAGIGLLFGATYATLALSFSAILRSRYMVLAAPFLFYWTVSIIIDLAGFPGSAPWNALNIFGPPASMTSILLPLFLLLSAGTLCLIPEVKKDCCS